MKVIKVNDQYLGLVDRQRDALRFEGPIVSDISLADIGGGRVVKLKTLADRTAESMRGLATDIEGDK